MTWTPISNTVPQYAKNAGGAAASGYYLKFYAGGTTTPINMATDSTGGTTLAKCQLNSLGYPINGSGDVFIPHIDQDYKLALYENATDADNNTLVSAAWVVDSLSTNTSGTIANTDGTSLTLSQWFDRQIQVFDTVTDIIAATELNAGDYVVIRNYAADRLSGPMFGEIVAAATGTDDGGSYIDLTGSSTQFKQVFEDSINIMKFGAYNDKTNATTTTAALNNAIAYAISISTAGGKKPKLIAPAGRYLLEQTGSTGQAVLFDASANNFCWGLVLEGAGMWETAFHMYDDAVICFRGTESTDLSGVRQYFQLRNFSIFGSSTLTETTITNVGVDFRQCPNAVLENIYIDNFGTGLKTQNSFNSTVQQVLAFNCPVLPFDIKTNSNDICFLNCVGEGIPGSTTYAFKAESSHGISIKGGAYENADKAFRFDACEYTLDTYAEACTEGVLESGTSSPQTYGNILNLYSYNNGENTGTTGEGLIDVAGGVVTVSQLHDTTARTPAARVFHCTGGGKALYGILDIESVTAIGDFVVGSAGYIKPMFEAPIAENVSTINTANVASTEYIGRAARPWKVQQVEIYRLSGDISGCNIQIGNTTDPDSLVNFTLANSAFQVVNFAATSTVELATTANITLSGEQTIDGVLTSADRVLVKDQTDATENGVYVSSSGAWTRATDADASNEIWLFSASVTSGTANSGKDFTNTNTTQPTIGTDNITFSETTGGITQTAGSYTNQTGYFILTNDGGGSSGGTFQVVFRYYNGYSGNTELGNINNIDKYIDSQNGAPAPISIQNID